MISSVPSENCYEFRGLAADFEAKKSDKLFNQGVGNGSLFVCMDTMDVYMFDKENITWIKIS